MKLFTDEECGTLRECIVSGAKESSLVAKCIDILGSTRLPSEKIQLEEKSGQGSISLKTASRIIVAYREIENATELLDKLEKATSDPFEPIRDVFGRPKNCLQLGVPSGDTAHRILEVRPDLAMVCIKAHIDDKKIDLANANREAWVELK